MIYKSIVRNLRKEQTDAEKLLWKHLRSRRLAGIKFRRQQQLGPFIPDFISFEAQVIIELDGGHHAKSVIQDQRRDIWFRKQGFHVLRFWNNEVLGNTEGVLEAINEWIEKHKHFPGIGGLNRAGNRWHGTGQDFLTADPFISPSPRSPPIKGGEE
jgi:very-short-patch-repair endonuclease